MIRRILANESCLAVLPTGAGKSLLYMLPSQLFEGITLVVSPLLALMRDQVEVLRSLGLEAARLDSSMSLSEIQQTTADIRANKVKVLYVSPERFNNEGFRRVLERMKVSMFVVDEAHCISEWGHAFRPDYLRLSHFAAVSNAQVRLALTATATTRVSADILDKLEISPNNVVHLPSIRRNLHLAVRAFAYPHDGYDERLAVLLENIETLTGGGAAIVYVTKQKLAERLAEDLQEQGLNARAYHAGMTTEDREDVEYWFLSRKKSYSKAPIVVGTVAFGMGIDKSDIRSVVHFDLPRCALSCLLLIVLSMCSFVCCFLSCHGPISTLPVLSQSACFFRDVYIPSRLHTTPSPPSPTHPLRSVEEYVQGCGRAGRDLQDASCLAFLAASDLPYLRNQIFGSTPHRDAVAGMIKVRHN